MRTMKDRERFFLIVKIFLDVHGPATSREIAEYIKTCPVRLQKEFTSVKIGVLLRGQTWVNKEKENGRGNWTYSIKG